MQIIRREGITWESDTMTIKKIEMINKTLEEAREDLEETQELNVTAAAAMFDEPPPMVALACVQRLA